MIHYYFITCLEKKKASSFWNPRGGRLVTNSSLEPL